MTGAAAGATAGLAEAGVGRIGSSLDFAAGKLVGGAREASTGCVAASDGAGSLASFDSTAAKRCSNRPIRSSNCFSVRGSSPTCAAAACTFGFSAGPGSPEDVVAIDEAQVITTSKCCCAPSATVVAGEPA